MLGDGCYFVQNNIDRAYGYLENFYLIDLWERVVLSPHIEYPNII